MWASRTLSGKLNDPTVIVAPGRPAAGACADEPPPAEAVHAAHSTDSARQTERRTTPRPCILSSCALQPWAGQYPRQERAEAATVNREAHILSLQQTNSVAVSGPPALWIRPGCGVMMGLSQGVS